MLKKMLLLLMATMMLVVPVSAEDVALDAAPVAEEAVELTYEQKALMALGFITTDSTGGIDMVSEVTREEFAGKIGGMITIDPTYSAEKTYYTDVEPNHWSTHTINKLVETGVLTLPADRLFRPKDKITFNEAVKVFVCILGYGEVAAQGGFPNGYLKVANQIDLLDGVDKSSKYLTSGAMADLMFNAMNIDMLAVQGVGSYVAYSDEEKNTILSTYHDIYPVEGVVESITGMSISGEDVGINHCIIDGEIYNMGKINMDGYLGYQIEGYYKKHSNSKELIFVDAPNTVVLTVTSDNVDPSKTGAKAVYYYDKNDKLQSAKISDTANFISNGEVIFSNIDAALEIDNGEIRMIDNDEDSVYDTIFVEDYTTIVVKYTNPTDKLIINALDETNPIDLSEEVIKQTWFYDEGGNSLTFDEITAGCILDLAVSDSGDYAVGRVTRSVFSGKIEAIQYDEQLAIIDGVEYTYYEEAKDVCYIESGKTGEFKLNKFGKIAFFTAGSAAAKPGYLINIAEGQGMDATIKVRMLNASGTVEVLNTVDKISIDGKAGNTIDVFAALSAMKGQVVLYRQNGAGAITFVDSMVLGDNENAETSLEKKGFTSTGGGMDQRFSKSGKKFGKKFLLADNAVMFKVPNDELAEDRYFKTVTVNDVADNQAHDAEFYSARNTSYVNYVVFKAVSNSRSENTDPYLWCTKVFDGVSEAGDQVKFIEAYNGNTLTTMEVMEGYSEQRIPRRGDVFRVTYNSDGKVNGIDFMYDYKYNGHGCKHKSDPLIDNGYAGYAVYGAGKGTHGAAKYLTIRDYWNRLTDLQYVGRIVIGTVIELDGGLMSWGLTREDNAQTGEIDYMIADEIADVSTSVVMVYDAAADRFYEGSAGDIKPIKTYGAYGASEIIGLTTYGKLKTVYVINNREYPVPEPSDKYFSDDPDAPSAY